MRKFVLLICHDRSGSNLVRAMINEHASVYLLPPLPLYERLFPHIALYGDLGREANWSRLVADAVELVAANHHPLEHTVSFDEVIAGTKARTRSLGSVCQACFDVLAEKSGKPIGGLKSGVQSDKLASFLATTNFTHAVFQYRDPRDVCLSAYKSARYPVEPVAFVRHWLAWHRNVRTALNQVMPGRVVEIRYENLVSDSYDTLLKVWNLLDLEPVDASDFHRSRGSAMAAATSYMWENLAKPLMAENFSKFYSEWNYKDIAAMEDALGAGLGEFHYERSDPSLFASKDTVPTIRALSDKDRLLTKAPDEATLRIVERLKARK